MAIQATTEWRIRAGGDETNGAGFDPDISGAGTDYTDQDAAELSLTDLACTAAAPTTLSSVTGGFTTAMIGNCIRIDASVSGSNFIDGHFFITARADTNTVTLDRTCNNGSDASGGTGKVGGATDHPSVFSDGTYTTPTIASPLGPGHTVWIRGAGLDEPTVTDFTVVLERFAAGDAVNGLIQWKGYNGRPLLYTTSGYGWYATSFHAFEGLKAKMGGTNQIFYSAYHVHNCHFDANGLNTKAVRADNVTNCYFYNSGSQPGTATNYAIHIRTSGSLVRGNVFDGWPNAAIRSENAGMTVCDNIIVNGGDDGIRDDGVTQNRWISVFNNVIAENAGDGIKINNALASNMRSFAQNNIIVGNDGYGINMQAGDAATNARIVPAHRHSNNAFKDNTSGPYNNRTSHDDDINLTADPFVDYSNGDWSLNDTAGGGADCKAAGLPGVLPVIGTTVYVDIGLQAEAAAGGGTTNVYRRSANNTLRM